MQSQVAPESLPREKMPKIKISDFSCIDFAEIELAKLTVFIGAQASGKSVISKLVYFFYDVLQKQFGALQSGVTFDDFQEECIAAFKESFPFSAWGKKRFVIEFEAGPYQVRVDRSYIRKLSSDKMNMSFSSYFKAQYEGIRVVSQKAARADHEHDPTRAIASFFRVRDQAENRLAEDLGPEYPRFQMFIPAGRSFFTSIGKAVTAFEFSGVLDQPTIRFGRLFVSLKDNWGADVYGRRKLSEEQRRQREALGSRLFGGKIKVSRTKDYVEADDGRIVPFSSLSSGQQELIPLWIALDYVARRSTSTFVYIEEPEAHLFPSAQSMIVEYLAGLVSAENHSVGSMLITTHSPYVLSKINNLLKAGALAAEFKERREMISRIVPKDVWIEPGMLAAYAIVDRTVRPIVDDLGLIDGEYLDGISGAIGEEYSKLLEIEYASEN